MKEGEVTHQEVNAALAAADKTIIFGRQKRLRDGVLIEGEQVLQRFLLGNDSVKFFYSAVRQLPEYFLDALLARNISVTLVMGQGLICFKDVRNFQALHSGRTRRTIYLPEKILDVAFRNGYDYWSITQILFAEGWKLLDFVLLLDLIEEAKRYMLDHAVPILGYNTLRRFLRARNKHRSWYESEELRQQRDKFKLDIAISEMEEFIRLYEKPFLELMRLGADYLEEEEEPDWWERPEEDRSFLLMSSDAAAKALYDEYQEEVWGTKKAEEFCAELDFPDYFLLDRDVIHPAARDMAAAAGHDLNPQNMDEARHDYRDTLRFGIGPEVATEQLVEEGVRFGCEGLVGLVEEIVAFLFAEGRPNTLLQEWTWKKLTELTSIPLELEVLLERGLKLARLGQTLRFFTSVRAGEIELHGEDVEFLRGLLLQLAQTKGGEADTRTQMILLMQDVREMADQQGDCIKNCLLT